MWYVISKDELYHHGIKGQRWGIRRFQNEDGSVTNAGAKRYYVNDGKVRKNDDSVTGKRHHEINYTRVKELDGSIKKTKDKTYYDKNGNVVKQKSHTTEIQKKEKKDSKKRKPLSKKAKVAIGVGVVAATTTVAVLATRKYNSEKKVLDSVLKTYGTQLIKNQEKLTNRIHDLETNEKYRNSSFKELTNKANTATRAAEKRNNKARDIAKNSSGIARYLSNDRLDSLAYKQNFGDKITNKDLSVIIAKQTVDYGKQAIERILNAA